MEDILDEANQAARNAEAKHASHNMEDFGMMIASFFTQMVKSGMHRKEALKLTIVWLNSFMYTNGPDTFSQEP